MGDTQRFTFRVSEDVVSRAEFLANQGPFVSPSDVYRAAIRMAWYDQNNGEPVSADTQMTERGNIRISEQMRKRLDVLADGPFNNRADAVRYGLDRVWRREMTHKPSKEVRSASMDISTIE